MVKKRVSLKNNYKAFYFNNKTLRTALDTGKPITELEFPEFYDVKITSKCEGNCPWCYMDSKSCDSEYTDIVSKIESFFKKMDNNERPFQVAIGGGEPTSHSNFTECLKAFHELGIVPNYTTNGMFIDSDNCGNIIEATNKYCGGVAVSCHPHLKKYWEKASDLFFEHNIKLNFHIIISDKKSIDSFMEIYNKWKDKVEYFVLLPYSSTGRAPKKNINWKYLVKALNVDSSKIAFGANFHKYLINTKHNFKVSIYEPENFSKFLDLKDMKLYRSSFDESYFN